MKEIKFNELRVEDLRQHLVNTGKFTREDVDAIKGKSNLVKLVEEHVLSEYSDLKSNTDNKDETDGGKFEDLVEIVDVNDSFSDSLDKCEQKVYKEVPETKYASVGWNDYVMSQFEEDELVEGNPTVFGLRRVAENLLGEVVFSGPVQVTASLDSTSPGRASCLYEVAFAWKRVDTGFVSFEEMADEGYNYPRRVFRGFASAYPGSVSDPTYQVYPEALAENRAEGRALRKALGLRTVCSDELSGTKMDVPVLETAPTTGEVNEDSPMTETQQKFITRQCNNLKVDVEKFITNELSPEKTFETITYGDALKLIKKLSEYQSLVNKSDNVPEEIKV